SGRRERRRPLPRQGRPDVRRDVRALLPRAPRLPALRRPPLLLELLAPRPPGRRRGAGPDRLIPPPPPRFPPNRANAAIPPSARPPDRSPVGTCAESSERLAVLAFTTALRVWDRARIGGLREADRRLRSDLGHRPGVRAHLGRSSRRPLSGGPERGAPRGRGRRPEGPGRLAGGVAGARPGRPGSAREPRRPRGRRAGRDRRGAGGPRRPR